MCCLNFINAKAGNGWLGCIMKVRMHSLLLRRVAQQVALYGL
jgi:hypothetical protein